MSLKERLSEILTCSVCLDLLKDPKTLPCQHTFCSECLRVLIGDSTSHSCPQCRADFDVPSGGPSGLPTNSSLRSVVDVLAEESPKKPKLPLAEGGVDIMNIDCPTCVVCSERCTSCEKMVMHNLEVQLVENVDRLLMTMEETSRKLKDFESRCNEVKENVRREMGKRRDLINNLETKFIHFIDNILEAGQKNGSEILMKLEINTTRILEILSSDWDQCAKRTTSEKVAVLLDAHLESSSVIEDANNLTRLETPTFSAESLSISHPDKTDVDLDDEQTSPLKCVRPVNDCEDYEN